MPHILIIGYHPDSVDFDDPGSPRGLTKDAIWKGVEESLTRIANHGWVGVQCMVRPDRSATAEVEHALASRRYDCVVIGGGIRLSHNHVPVLEAIIDTVRRHAPAAPIVFNTGPASSLEAAQRWVSVTPEKKAGKEKDHV